MVIVIDSRIIMLFMVGVLVLVRWVCGLLLCIICFVLSWVSLWIIVGLNSSDIVSVVSVVMMVWKVMY